MQLSTFLIFFKIFSIFQYFSFNFYLQISNYIFISNKWFDLRIINKGYFVLQLIKIYKNKNFIKIVVHEKI